MAIPEAPPWAPLSASGVAAPWRLVDWREILKLSMGRRAASIPLATPIA
jgi:hypothetical protein